MDYTATLCIDQKTQSVVGAYKASRQFLGLEYFLPNVGSDRRIRLESINSLNEVVAVDGGPIFIVDFKAELYKVVAEHHYAFMARDKTSDMLVLMNQELLWTDFSGKKVVTIPYHLWSDLETRNHDERMQDNPDLAKIISVVISEDWQELKTEKLNIHRR